MGHVLSWGEIWIWWKWQLTPTIPRSPEDWSGTEVQLCTVQQSDLFKVCGIQVVLPPHRSVNMTSPRSLELTTWQCLVQSGLILAFSIIIYNYLANLERASPALTRKGPAWRILLHCQQSLTKFFVLTRRAGELVLWLRFPQLESTFRDNKKNIMQQPLGILHRMIHTTGLTFHSSLWALWVSILPTRSVTLKITVLCTPSRVRPHFSSHRVHEENKMGKMDFLFF